ncbi:glycoside hydrolase family 27 protein [Calocera cornea HHB12733]|uniref:Alpha-galactosidase n=1 Tax=Calocera cornea HHB12733 TaxID=1353952 RepID=A0A165GG87_9BASI|nr:glycoside hydrolase family 27 protein [Calocera cornea HHB12733]
MRLAACFVSATCLATIVLGAPIEQARPETPPLNVLRYSTTPNGFNRPPRGWNSFGMQVGIQSATHFALTQNDTVAQCDLLADPDALGGAGYEYCSLDSGWSIGDHGDEYGRLMYIKEQLDLPALADHLHAKGLKLGVYVVPGAFAKDANKTIYGTNIRLNDTLSGHNNGLARIDFNYSRNGVQQWHNSVVNLFAEWGVDFIKLDFITPGSPENGVRLSPDTSGSVIAFHKAISQASRPMRLDVSWKLERNVTYYDVWKHNADSMRVDQDINNMGAETFVSWATVQRAIDNYRQYINLHTQSLEPLTIYPDLDNLYVGNAANISGITDAQRQTMMTFWLGAGANLLIGSDLLQLDEFGKRVLTDREALAIADFTAQYPMQPRNPGTGGNNAQQLQAWIAGPSDATGESVVVVANLGPPLGQSGYEGQKVLTGHEAFELSFESLGIAGTYKVRNIWEHRDLSIRNSGLRVLLGEGESELFKLTPAILLTDKVRPEGPSALRIQGAS